MNTAYFLACIIFAYLLGSIPTAVWVGRYFYDMDVREHGSGNAGATNTFRVLGRKAGIPVMLVDILKGFLATSLAKLIPAALFTGSGLILFMIALGLLAVLGHIYPIFANFRGGKGIATLFGMILAINPPAALICLGVFLLMLILSHYVSLSSMSAATAYPLIILLIFPSSPPAMLYFGIAVFGLVFYTHRKNISRLLNHSESRVYLFKKPKDQDTI